MGIVQAEELLLGGAAHLIDNFLDEMLEFAGESEFSWHVVEFIQRAV